MGKVAVGTGPCFFLNEFSALIPVQQTFGFPPRPTSPAAVSHPLPHCSPVSSPGLAPPPDFGACEVCHVVLWRELSSGRGRSRGDTPSSHDLLPFLPRYCLLTTQSRKLVHKVTGSRVCQFGLCWVSIVLDGGLSQGPCAFVVSEAHRR